MTQFDGVEHMLLSGCGCNSDYVVLTPHKAEQMCRPPPIHPASHPQFQPSSINTGFSTNTNKEL